LTLPALSPSRLGASPLLVRPCLAPHTSFGVPSCSPLERSRIERTGGWVVQTALDEEGRPAGPHRVYLRESTVPGLAVSRCFGDYGAWLGCCSSCGVVCGGLVEGKFAVGCCCCLGHGGSQALQVPGITTGRVACMLLPFNS
jgi:hypothetical protein